MKRITQTLAIIALLLLPAKSFSQSMLGDIFGSVVDGITGEPLISAHVKALRGDQMLGQALTDLDGNFSIKALPSGSYNLMLTFSGKDTLLITGVVVNADKITWRRNIGMSDNNELKGFTVKADLIPLIDPEEPSAQTIGYKQIKNNPNLRDMSKLLGTLTTDIKTGIDGGDAYVRGSRSSSTVYFVDGVKQVGSASMPGSAIGKVTVYTGGVPAKYGDTTGGVIILETKSYFDLYNERRGQ